MTYVSNELKERSLQAVQMRHPDYQTRFVCGVLYGSVAMGFGTPLSDLDILLVLRQDALYIADEEQVLLPDGSHVELSYASEVTLIDAQRNLSSDMLDAGTVRMLEDLIEAIPLFSPTWLERYNAGYGVQDVARHMLRQHVVSCHTLFKDTLGAFLEDDFVSATSVGRRLAECSYDLLCAIDGSFSSRGKWRYRRFSSAQSLHRGGELRQAFMAVLLTLMEGGGRMSLSGISSSSIRLYQIAMDRLSLLSGNVEFDPWKDVTSEQLNNSILGDQRSIRHYLCYKDSKFAIFFDGIPTYEFDKATAIAWASLGRLCRGTHALDCMIAAGFSATDGARIYAQFADAGLLGSRPRNRE